MFMTDNGTREMLSLREESSEWNEIWVFATPWRYATRSFLLSVRSFSLSPISQIPLLLAHVTFQFNTYTTIRSLWINNDTRHAAPRSPSQGLCVRACVLLP